MDSFGMEVRGDKRQYESGMERESSAGKPRYDLLWLPGLKRLALLLEKGISQKGYAARNWESASSPEELNRFKESAFRHFIQWQAGETDEDHLSAVVFNMWGAENCLENMKKLRGSEE